MGLVIETRNCPVCKEDFTPIPRRSDGGLPPACKDCIRKFHGRARKGQMPEGFRVQVAEKKQRARLRREQQLAREFGPVTEREAAIFAYGLGEGYNQGYNIGYRRPRTSAAT